MVDTKRIETEHGIFTNNEFTGQTAQEVYTEWLLNKDKPPQPSEIEQHRIESAQANAELFEMMLMLMGGTM